MEEQQNIEERIWNYIDGSADANERSLVEQLINNDAQWKAKYAELLEVHELMKTGISLDEPSMRFTQNVMEEISRLYITPAAQTYINKKIIGGIAIFFITTIVGLLLFIMAQVSWQTPGLSNVVEQNLERFNWNKIFSANMNLFIITDIVLALVLLDMYLRKKKKAVNP